jgi:hypothetical protein
MATMKGATYAGYSAGLSRPPGMLKINGKEEL